VRIDTPSGSFTFLEEDFTRIVPGQCPEREWCDRRDAALKSGAGDRFAAAWWALENGLTPESVAMLRSAHDADPNHQPTARLMSVLAKLDRPCTDPELDTLRGALGTPCEVARGAHILLLHQHSSAEASARIELLERVVTTYYLMLAAEGLDLLIPAERLTTVYLRDHNDYLTFLRSQHAGAFQTTLGYYHPTFRAMIAYDPRSSPAIRAGQGRLARLLRERPGESAEVTTPSSELRRPEADMPPETTRAEGSSDESPLSLTRRDAERRRFLLAMENCSIDRGTAAHEMIHLLVHASGLASDPGRFPLWLHEGFAAQFEVVRGGRWAGFGRTHDRRLPDWRAISSRPDLGSLIGDAGFGRGYRHDLYANAWALVFFLRKTRPERFQTFLDLLRLPDPASSPSDHDRVASHFRAAFGHDLAALEAEWRVFIDGIHTPLEKNAPADSNGSGSYPSVSRLTD
jgi:hypothetical protein